MNTAVEKACALGDAVYTYNEQYKGYDHPKIRVDITLYGGDTSVEVKITRFKGLTTEDIQFILDQNKELKGNLTFQQTGVVNVIFN